MDEAELRTIGELLERVAPGVIDLGHSPDGDGKIVAVRRDNGYLIEHRKGPKESIRKHRFDTLESFAAWVCRNQRTYSEVFLSAACAEAVMVPHSPNTETAVCPMTRHPLLAEWCNVFDKPFSQRDLYLFLRANCRAIVGEFAMDLPNAIMRLSSQSYKDADVKLDPRGFYAVTGATERINVTSEVPAGWAIRVPVFEGVRSSVGSTLEYEIEVMLILDNSGDAWRFTLRCPSLKLVEADALRDASDFLSRLLVDFSPEAGPAPLTVYRGSAHLEQRAVDLTLRGDE